MLDFGTAGQLESAHASTKPEILDLAEVFDHGDWDIPAITEFPGDMDSVTVITRLTATVSKGS